MDAGRSGWRFLLLTSIALTIVITLGTGQAEGQLLRALFGDTKVREEPETPADNFFSAILPPSEEATTLLGRANEGIQREDWKLVIDSLQRIVELPGEHVLARDQRVYESARHQAHRRIAELPPAGLEAYRLVHDGEASALLERAIESHDASLLRTVVERYLLTRSGDDAAVTLADWLIDEGRFAEAAALLERVRSIYPDSDLPGWVLPARLAICAASMGQRQRARQWFDTACATRPSASGPSHAPALVAPAELIEQLRGFITRTAPPAETFQADCWPMDMGTLRRDGRMPAIEPTLLDHPPWNLALTVSKPKPDLRTLEQYARERELTSTRTLVTDGSRLVLKTDRAVLAMDPDSFTTLWRTEPPEWAAELAAQDEEQQRAIIRQAGRQGGDTNPLDNDPTMWRLLYDTVGAGLTIVGDRVLTIEWQGEPPMPMSMMFGGSRRTRTMLGASWMWSDGSASTGNRVAAYSLADGSRLWVSDTTALAAAESPPKPKAGAPGEEQTSQVQFLSVPVPVGPYLLATCRVNADLYAALLDPATGAALRHVYLCGTGGGPFDVHAALPPAVAQGLAFIPTGRGLLLAVETDTWSVRWAVRYQQIDANSWAPTWDPGPPVAVSDVVLLAPTDAEFLYCFDQASGQERWRAPRDGARYILAASDLRVWTAGQQVQMHEIETGRTLWKADVPLPTGRGVMTGEQILMPTVEGLTVIDSATGAQSTTPLPATIEPLGNLFAWDGSLYSVAISRIRKFPDLKQGYAEARRRHQVSPADPSAAVRLASLELLQRRPDQALAALADLPDILAQSDPRRHEQVAHLRVQAALELASSDQVPAAKALALLREAKSVARLPADAIDATLALTEHYRRQGQPLQAALELLDLVSTSAGDVTVTTEPGLTEPARARAGRRIALAVNECDPQQLDQFRQRARERLDQATAQHDWDSLLRLAQCPALGELANWAKLRLGVWAEQDLRFEQAETLLADVLRRAQSPELRAEAAARLADIYLSPEELHLPVSATALLDQLAGQFASVMLPADVLRPAGELPDERPRDRTSERRRNRPTTQDAAPLNPSGPPRALAGGEVAEALGRRIKVKKLSRNRAAMDPVSLGPPELPTTSHQPGSRPLLVRGPRPEPLADITLAIVEGQRVEASAVGNNRQLWPAELRLLGQPARDAKPPQAMAVQQQMEDMAAGQIDSPARAVRDGQTLILNSAYGVHAIGLLTGRRLWARTFEPPSGTLADPCGSDAWLWVHDGYVITVNANRELEIASTFDGERILWRRSLPQQDWYAVRARGQYVVVVDRSLENVVVFRLEDGSALGQCRFFQPANAGQKVNLALFDDVLCGPVSEREIAALELAAPGTERWRWTTPDSLSQLFKPSAELLAVADRSGRIELIDPASGKPRLAANAYGCEAGVVDGAAIGDTLYVYGYQKRAANAVAINQQRWALAAISMTDGQVRWQQSDIAAGAFLTSDLLRAASDAIPLVVFRPATDAAKTPQLRRAGDEQAQAIGVIELTILDKATGQIVGNTVSATVPRNAGGGRILDVQVWPGKVVVYIGSIIVRFPVPARDGTPAGTVQSGGSAK